MEHQEAEALFDKYRRGETNAAENALVESWYLNEVAQTEPVGMQMDYEMQEQRIWSRIQEQKAAREDSQAVKKIWMWPRIAAVSMSWKLAVALAVITLGTWLYYTSSISGSSSRGIEGSLAYATDIAPGKNTATLTLANGKTINLSDAHSGVVISASTFEYNDGSKIDDSSLRGTLSSRGTAKDLGPTGLGMLTASTPRGGTYQVTLPDGTRVWLNADSKISFPSQLSEAKRRVSLEGEAYFQVAKDKAHPFIVESKGQEVEVLGTQFNVNAYADERVVTTTLVEGSVRVGAEGKTVVIKPGEQALQEGQAIRVGKANLESTLDWKNGDIVLDDIDLRSALRKIARWYNIEVVYDNSVPDNIKSGGWISRDTKLSEVLALIEKSGQVKLKLEGRRLRVMR